MDLQGLIQVSGVKLGQIQIFPQKVCCNRPIRWTSVSNEARQFFSFNLMYRGLKKLCTKLYQRNTRLKIKNCALIKTVLKSKKYFCKICSCCQICQSSNLYFCDMFIKVIKMFIINIYMI